MSGIKISKSSSSQTSNNTSFDISAWLKKDISLGFLSKKKVTDKEKEAFYLELNTLFSSGVDIRTCLDLLQKESKKSYFSGVLQDFKDRIIHGASLSESMMHSKDFSPYEYYSIQIGEEMGNLTVVFKQISDFYAKKIKQRRQIISALSYPLLILSSSLLAVVFMLYFIVPMFSEIFKRFGGELPFITQQIINASQWLETNFYIILLVIVAMVVSVIMLKEKTWFKIATTNFIVRIPLIGKVYVESNLTKFCSSMALLIGAKIPLIRAIQLVKQMIDFHPIKHSLDQIEEDMLQGKSLHESFAQFSIYDARMLTLIKIGEEVNKTDVFFNKLAENYSESVDHKTQLISTFLEPIIIVLLGLIVGFVLIAMYLPMFQLSGGIG